MTLDSIMKCAFSCHSNCQTNRSVLAAPNPGRKFAALKGRGEIGFCDAPKFTSFHRCPIPRKNTYIQAVYDLCLMVHQRLRIFPYHNDFIYWLSPHGYRFRKVCQIAHDHTGIPCLHLLPKLSSRVGDGWPEGWAPEAVVLPPCPRSGDRVQAEHQLAAVV